MATLTRVRSKVFISISLLVGGICILLASVPLIIDWNEDGSAANAATYNWNLLNVDNFSLDSNKIQVTQGAANLKKLDQTDNDNSLSGFGAGDFAGTQWSEAAGGLILTPEGLQAGSGSFTSRILDAGAPVAWSALSVSPAAPFGKELPDGGLSENGYSTGNANMTGNTALLHFNEDDGSANFADSSSLSNNGSCAAGKCPAAASGVFGNAAHFDGLDDYVDIGTADNLALGNNFTIEAWINPEDMGNYRTIASKAGSFFFAQANVGGSLRIATYFFGLKYATWQAANDSIPLYSWSHVAITFDGTNIRFYVNGKLSRQANNPGSVTSPGGNSVFVGSRSDLASKAYKFKGGIDEAAIYNRVLTTEELSARYRRGAVKWNLQARSCANADCAGAVFVGPDGTAGSYYSEGQNSTSSTPSFGLVTAPAARYFQYSLQLQTTTSSPAINAVSVLPDHFYADAPAIVPQSSSALAYSSALLGFSAAESGAGRVYYQLTNNADAVSPTWYFWNGSSWTAAVNPTDYNTSSTINEAITSFHTQLGSGNFSWRAFLTSSGGADPVGLSWVSVAYNQPPLAPEALYAGSTQAQSGATNPTDISSATPHFSGVYQDNDPVAEGTKARIQVSVDPTFSSVTHWDSGEVGAIIAPTATSTRIADIVYGSFGAAPLQPLSLDDGQITYYWRLQLGDDHSFGPFSQGGFFTLLDKPSAPASMSASRTNDTFLLNWQDLSTNEDSFVVERADDTGSGQGDWIVVATLPANATSYHDTATRASAQYWYRVMAANQAGSSEPATDNVSHYTTPAAPTNVFAQYGPDSAFSVNYTAVGAVENIFSVERCVNADCDNSAYTPVLGSPFSSSPQIDNLVSPNSRYRYRVRVGSEETTTSTFGYSDYEYTPPSAPTGVQAQYVSDDRIQLTWQDTSGYESGFVVYAAEDGGEYQAVSSTAAYTVGQNVAAYTYVLGAKDHSYKFKIRAYIGGTSANPELFSADSNETEVVYTSPSAPVMESPTVLSATSVQWNFSSSSVLAGGWRVYSLAGTVVSTLTTNSATSITEDNLSPGTCYTRRLAAFTPSSESALSSEKMACTWAQPPAGPQASSLTEGSLVLTWSTGNNSTSTEYLAVNTVTGANSGWKTENTWLVSGLSCGTQYAFNVKARNLAGVETGNSDTLTVATAACGESDTETESSGWSQSESVSIEPDETAETPLSVPVSGPGPSLTTTPVDGRGGTLPDKLPVEELPPASSTLPVLPPAEIISSTPPVPEEIPDSLPATKKVLPPSVPSSSPVAVIPQEKTKPLAAKKNELQPAVPVPPPATEETTRPEISAPAEPQSGAGSLSPEIKAEIEDKATLLAVVDQPVPRYYRLVSQPVEAVKGESIQILVHPKKPVHSITARVYLEDGKELSAEKTKWLQAFMLEAADASSPVYRGTVSSAGLAEGKYRLQVSFNHEDGTKQHLERVIEVKKNEASVEEKSRWQRFRQLIKPANN